MLSVGILIVEYYSEIYLVRSSLLSLKYHYKLNNNNNYELYFELIKGGNTMGPPYIRPCLTDIG